MSAHSRTLLAVCLLASACPQSASDTESVSAFIAARDQLLCSLAASCCSPAVDAGACEAWFAPGQPLVDGADDAVKHGAATFDRARAEGCLAGLRQASCATPRPRSELDPCSLANTTFGTIQLGGACNLPGDNCAEGTFCHPDSPSSNGSGHCAAEVGAGESCADARCKFGLICTQALVCGAPLPDGAACDPESATGDCASEGCLSTCEPSSAVFSCPTTS